jgi:hypothetical protein
MTAEKTLLYCIYRRGGTVGLLSNGLQTGLIYLPTFLVKPLLRIQLCDMMLTIC